MYGTACPNQNELYGQTTGYVQPYYVTTNWLPSGNVANYRDTQQTFYRRPDLESAFEELRRIMRVQSHRPPPVAVDLASLPMPEPGLRPVPSGVAWLVRAHGGPHERKSRRRKERVWERAAA
jgi:hypothetical protein